MILYFSGTGNCKYVAEQIAAAVGDTAVSVEDSGGKIALEMGEIFGIVFPTHFWEIPAIMREFLEKASITAERENYAFAIATYGTRKLRLCHCDLRNNTGLQRNGCEETFEEEGH